MTGNNPQRIILWRPRADEHELARSLGMVDCDAETLQQIIESSQHQLAIDLPGTSVLVHRWHLWRVVRAMARANVLNDPAGRATAYGLLAEFGDRQRD